MAKESSYIVFFFVYLADLGSALTVADGAFSHKIDNYTIFREILSPEGHPNRITGSKVTAILLKGWILPICEA